MLVVPFRTASQFGCGGSGFWLAILVYLPWVKGLIWRVTISYDISVFGGTCPGGRVIAMIYPGGVPLFIGVEVYVTLSV